jgi:hypothetical protein
MPKNNICKNLTVIARIYKAMNVYAIKGEIANIAWCSIKRDRVDSLIEYGTIGRVVIVVPALLSSCTPGKAAWQEVTPTWLEFSVAHPVVLLFTSLL